MLFNKIISILAISRETCVIKIRNKTIFFLFNLNLPEAREERSKKKILNFWLIANLRVNLFNINIITKKRQV